MKAKAIFITNENDIQAMRELNEAMNLNAPLPVPVYESDDFYFKLEEVSLMFKTVAGDITIMIRDRMWTLEYNEQIEIQIINHLNKEND